MHKGYQAYIEKEEGNQHVFNLEDYYIIDVWICEKDEDENDAVEYSVCEG